MTDIYLVKGNISVALSPSGRVEETLSNSLYIKERGVSPRYRNLSKEKTGSTFGSDRNFRSATGTCQTYYAILSVSGVWDNSAGTGTNYWDGGSFSFKTITLGSVGTLNDNDRLWIDYESASGDTIVTDAGLVRDNYIITGNLVSNADGNIQDKKDNLKHIFLAGGSVALTYPSQNDSVNVFPTRITFVQNAGELEQEEVMMEAVFGYSKL